MNVREAQLFVDDYIIESYVRVHRTIHQPQKFGPVLEADRPWEGNAVVLYGTVLKHPETEFFQMWYQSFVKLPSPENTYVCYAVSQDGVHWEKPVVGDVEYRGSKENNIIVRGPFQSLDSPSVVFDQEEPNKSRRYNMLVYGAIPGGERGLFAAFSSDGVHWKLTEKSVAPMVGDRTNVMLDAVAERRYVAYTRRHTMMRDHKRRTIYRSESSDFTAWTDPELVLAPDLADSHDLQFYGMTAFRYGSLYLGFVQCLHSREDRNDVQLVTSRDNRSWHRTQPREVFMPNGPKESWDSAWVSIASNPPLLRDGRLWIYYEGRNAAHGQQYPFPRGSIGVATLRRDGFASIDAGPIEGSLTTKAFVWPGGKLLVNVNAKAGAGVTDGLQEAGRARLELLDENGGMIPGFSRDECQPFTRDSLDHEFHWTSGRDLNSLVGNSIKLRFHLVNAELYSFQAVT